MELRQRKTLLEILNAVIFGITIVGINILNMVSGKLPLLPQIILTITFVLLYYLIARQKLSEGIKSFEEFSPQFFVFFEKWYSLPGKLTIFCSDLDWLDNPKASAVVYALENKKDKLSLYLRRPEGQIVSVLRASGALVYTVKKEIITNHRFSMIDCDGLTRIIVRNKRTNDDSNRIEFKETNNNQDPYIISLAEDLLDDCYERQV